MIVGEIVFEIDLAGEVGRITFGKLDSGFILNPTNFAQEKLDGRVCYREPPRA